MFAIFADWGTKPAIPQLKDFNREIGMDTPAEFRKHAADCETMAKVSNDPETKAAWTDGGEMAPLRQIGGRPGLVPASSCGGEILKAATETASRLGSRLQSPLN